MIRGSKFIHLRRRDHPVDLEKKGSLVVLKRGTKKQQYKRCKRYEHQERTCKDPLPGDAEDASNSGANTYQRYY
jgi:hypothetical protein